MDIYYNIWSPWFLKIYFATIHNNDGLEKRMPKISKQLQRFSKMYNYKYWMPCKETTQPIRDKNYPHLPSKPIRNKVD